MTQELPNPIWLHPEDMACGELAIYETPYADDCVEYVRKDPATVAVPVEVIRKMEQALNRSLNRFEMLDMPNNDAAQMSCQEALSLLQPYTKGE